MGVSSCTKHFLWKLDGIIKIVGVNDLFEKRPFYASTAASVFNVAVFYGREKLILSLK